MAIPKPKLTAALKKKIKADWQQQIPSLVASPKGFFLSRLVGPLTIDVSFHTTSTNENYQPEFCVQNLCEWEDFLYQTMFDYLRKSRVSINGETIISPVYITVRAHEKGDYIEAAHLMKEQALLPLEGPISISMIAAAYQKYAQRPGTAFKMDLIQDPALIAAWGGREDLAKQYLEWGYETYKDWMANRRNPDIEDDTEAWLKTMQQRISDPETLRHNVREMIKRHGLEYLPQEELILE